MEARVAGVGEMITGRAGRRQQALAEAAQAEQARRVAEERARLDALERGQRQNAQVGGGGLLAYVDQAMAGGQKLRETLG